MNIFIIAWMIFVAAAFGYSIVVSILERRKKKANAKSNASDTDNTKWDKMQRELVEKTLAELNCEVDWTDDNGEVCAFYEYQSGHFKLMIDSRSPYVRLNYLFCYSEKLDKLNIARIVANKCNINSENIRIVYSINKEQNEVDMHIVSEMLLHLDNAKFLLKRNMAAAFVWQNALARQFAEVEQQCKNMGEDDVEKATAEIGREIALMKKQEGRQAVQQYDTAEDMTLKAFLEKAMDLEGFQPSRMTAHNSEGCFTTRNSDEIEHCMLSDALHEGGDATVHAFLWGFLPDMPAVERMISLSFSSEPGSEKLFRVTAALIPLSGNSRADDGSQRGRVHTCSVLMSKHSGSAMAKEAEYMWKEAVQKTKKQETDALTQPQLFVAACTDEDIAVDLYTAKKLFLEERYYEALLFFEDAFHAMQAQFDTMKKNQKDTFFDTIFHIGFCYGSLGQYAKALAYLEMVAPLHRIPYAMEMINCMVNSGDFRAENAVDSLIMTIRDGIMLEEGEKIPPHLEDFLAFLNRRKTAILLNKGKYGEAKILLKKMLNDPINADYAIDQLAHLQKKENDELTQLFRKDKDKDNE